MVCSRLNSEGKLQTLEHFNISIFSNLYPVLSFLASDQCHPIRQTTYQVDKAPYLQLWLAAGQGCRFQFTLFSIIPLTGVTFLDWQLVVLYAHHIKDHCRQVQPEEVHDFQSSVVGKDAPLLS